MNKDRGMIKWLPFSAVEDPSTIIKNIEKQKNYHKKPILSKDQIEMIENDILEAYHTQNDILIIYLSNGIYKRLKTKILKIEASSKKITTIQKVLYFEQIINTKLI